MQESTRRNFIKKTALAAGAIPLVGFPQHIFATEAETASTPLDIHIFSKHLQFLNYTETGKKAKEMGFAGVDLTVRPKGHVLPETVGVNLPKAIHEIEQGGSQCKLITTAVENIHNPLDVSVIKTAAACGVKYYRSGWLRYSDHEEMEVTLEKYKQQIKALSELNKTHGIVGCYQNHSGTFVGSSLWEIKQILAKANPDYFGTEYDIRHNVVEGANSWENELRLIRKHIKTLVIKDFKWAKINGKWKPFNTPVGQGMVDFKKYFRLLKDYNIHVPVTLHLEYDIGGAEHGARKLSVKPQVVFDAMQRDLETVQKLWKEA
ncbi:sugar phosphate isomerase/epimerase family protein [Flavicella sediminum]|uniref:sugar phosphate isomerase/epimerase family protein n=1 Tax=Flavicella sediminum TaxID=2585141 RepID=UPI00112436C0|nr:TIM barrel protein [Flavicella sediminum]